MNKNILRNEAVGVVETYKLRTTVSMKIAEKKKIERTLPRPVRGRRVSERKVADEAKSADCPDWLSAGSPTHETHTP